MWCWIGVEDGLVLGDKFENTENGRSEGRLIPVVMNLMFVMPSG